MSSNLCNLHLTLVSPSLCHFTPQTRLAPLPFFSSALPSLLPPHHTSAQSAQHSPLPSNHIDHRSCLPFSVQSIYQSHHPSHDHDHFYFTTGNSASAIIEAFHAGPDLYSTDVHTHTHTQSGNQFVFRQLGSVVAW